MGRGDRPPHSKADLRNGIEEQPQYEVVIAAEAEDELAELIQYIAKDSPKNAEAMLQAIFKRRDLLKRNPRIGHADPTAPPASWGASALRTTVKGIDLRYAFPLKRDDREIILIVSIRRGSRLPLREPDYLRRWLEELAGLSPTKSEAPREPAS